MTIPGLSAVEQQIVLLVAQGRSSRAIADELGLSLKTVEWHVARGPLKARAGGHVARPDSDNQRRKS